MKSKHYIKKYNLDGGELPGYNHNAFIIDISSDFMYVVESCKHNINLTRFKSVIKEIKQKWDSIFQNAKGDYTKLWNYFFATVIAPTRETICRAEIDKNTREYEKKKAEHEQWNNFYNQEQSYWKDLFKNEQQHFYENLYSRLLRNLFKESVPNESFTFLQLDITATIEDIKTSYRKLSLQMHPDKSIGSKELFQELSEHKNKCVAYAQRNEL